MFVESASFAINSLLQSYVMSRKSVDDRNFIHVLITDSAYMMVRNRLNYVLDNCPWMKLDVINLKEDVTTPEDVCVKVVLNLLIHSWWKCFARG